MDAAAIPLSLYVHIPWCVQKCPYCDFNSHQVKSTLDEGRHVQQLLRDLADQYSFIQGRELGSIFFGGGTPSLFSDKSIGYFLDQASQKIGFSSDIEITLEANPGTADANYFSGYRSSGVNRLSIGVQSLDDKKLKALGRIHSSKEAIAAVDMARKAGFENMNLDMMHGLPDQTLNEAIDDLTRLISLEPEHISWYQLTLEPNTLFYKKPPELPSDDLLADMMDHGQALLADEGYLQYEVSAYAKGAQAKHNVNYWQFGDYLAVGAGAHAKLTTPEGKIHRLTRLRNPKDYLASDNTLSNERVLAREELPIEFMLNACRLNEGVPADFFKQRTGLSITDIESQLAQAKARGLLVDSNDVIQPTALGHRFLNDLLAIFEPD
jgi:putative oxygen-independent coproporphyrinogen III oxidase